MKKLMLLIVCCCFICGCATSSVKINYSPGSKSVVAVLPLDGEYGGQASDYISEQLALNGIQIIERAQVDTILREHGYRENKNFDQSTLSDFGKMYGVKKVFTGTISEIWSPMYGFPHVNITLKLVDVATGKVLWIGRYGNSLWTSAISTQGDIQRGAKFIVQEFIKVYGCNLDQ